MNIYFAGTPGTKEREIQWQKKMHNRLLSFWDIYQDQFNVPFAFSLIKKRCKQVNK